MKKLLTLIFALALSSTIFAQTAPTAEPVFGGYVEDIAAIGISSTETRVYIATRSANSMFYTDISWASGTPVFSGFNVVPDFSASTNMGYISSIDADENSGFAFAAMEEFGLYGVGTSSGSSTLIDGDHVEAVKVHDGYLFYLKKRSSNLELLVGTIDPTTGNVVLTATITVASSLPWWPARFKLQIHINETNEHVYVFAPGAPPYIYESSDPYYSLSSTTTFSTITVNDLIATGKEYCAMGIAPDGKIFAAAYEGHSASYTAQISTSISDGDPWTTTSISEDMGRGEFSIVGGSGNYVVYYSRIVSLDKGSTWDYSEAADGAVAGDPNSAAIAYVRSDWAMKMIDVYNHVYEDINDGIQAVEVEAIGMNVGKSKAWIATKSGIWFVDNYDTPTPTWLARPVWPNGDSMPYVTAKSDQTGDIAYLGNVGGKLYKYDAALGPQDDPASYQIIFDATSAPSWTWTYGTAVSAVGIDYTSSIERIIIGLGDMEDWDETTPHQGGVFVGENSGGSWSWSRIDASAALPDGIDVFDIVTATESGNTVAYVAGEYNSSVTPTIYGIYRMEETSPGTWSVSQDLYTSSGATVSAMITDLAKSPSNEIYACGLDFTTNTPVVLYKAVGSTYWTSVTTSGLPTGADEIPASITMHNNDLYVAVKNTIYELPAGATTWSVYYSYPVGTLIKFIYYDDLLVGTGYGLFVHPNVNAVDDETNIPEKFELFQNYPNPFNPMTNITYVIASGRDAINRVSTKGAVQVSLKVYDALGREVATLVNQKQAPGKYSVQFNAASASGGLPSGVYFYTLRTGNFVQTRKMVLMK